MLYDVVTANVYGISRAAVALLEFQPNRAGPPGGPTPSPALPFPVCRVGLGPARDNFPCWLWASCLGTTFCLRLSLGPLINGSFVLFYQTQRWDSLEFDGRMQLIDGKVSEALSTFLSAAQTYASCDSKRHAACKQLVIFCRLVRQAAGGQDFPSIESADDALLEKLVPLTAAIAKADIGAIRSVVDDPSFAELANSGMHDAISKVGWSAPVHSLMR